MTDKSASEEQDSTIVSQYDGVAAADMIPEMVDRIVREFDPEQIILFGSHARGDAHRWSDVDLLVVFREVTDRRELSIAIQMLLHDLFVAKDIIVTSTEDLRRLGTEIGTVHRRALSEGRTLYDRGQ